MRQKATALACVAIRMHEHLQKVADCAPFSHPFVLQQPRGLCETKGHGFGLCSNKNAPRYQHDTILRRTVISGMRFGSLLDSSVCACLGHKDPVTCLLTYILLYRIPYPTGMTFPVDSCRSNSF